jgi:hypothetical protein
VPSEAKQREAERRRAGIRSARTERSERSDEEFTGVDEQEAESSAFRAYARNMDVAERYEAAVNKLYVSQLVSQCKCRVNFFFMQ